jgi:hypothetical protein
MLISPAITVDTAAYSGGDVIGGVLQIINGVSRKGGSAVLESLLVIDKANQKKAMNILLFRDNPAAGTYSDNGAFTLHATDAGLLVASVAVAATDYLTLGGVAVAAPAINPQIIDGVGGVGSSVYAIIVAGEAIDFVATTDLIIKFGLLRE